MKKIQGLWRGEVGAGISHSLLQNPKKTPNIKIICGHKQRGYEEKTELEKMPLEMTTISHSKTSNNTWRQLKAPENNSRWRWAENTSTQRRAKYGKERKISGNSAKEWENRNPTRLFRMSGEDTKLGGVKMGNGWENRMGNNNYTTDYGGWWVEMRAQGHKWEENRKWVRE